MNAARSNTMTTLTEDEIDDILYFARANELEDLQSALQELATTHSIAQDSVCSAAVDGETLNGPLHYAAGNGHLEVVKFLLKLHNATPLAETDSLSHPSTPPPPIVNQANKAGNTALHWAALNGHVQVILLLLAHGADPSILNGAGHDALYEAEVNEKEAAVEVLLREGGQLEDVVNGQQGEEDGEEEEEEEGGDDDTLAGDEVKDIEDGETLVEDVEKLSTS